MNLNQSIASHRSAKVFLLQVYTEEQMVAPFSAGNRRNAPVASESSRSRSARTKTKPSHEMEPEFMPIAAAFAEDPSVELGRRFSANSVLSVKGKIFCMFTRGNFVAKLPRMRVEALVAAGAGENFDPGHGRLMKEWIAIHPDTSDCLALAREAYRFVSGEQPQAKKRSRRAAPANKAKSR